MLGSSKCLKCTDISFYILYPMESNTEAKAFFTQSDKYKPQGVDSAQKPAPKDIPGIQEKLWEYVHQNATKNDPVSVYQTIDKFCKEHWMMNLGPEKGVIIRDQVEALKPKTVLELGTYCGYSAIFFSTITPPDTKIYTLEVNEKTMEVSHKIFEWAGVLGKVIQLRGNIQQNIQEVKNIGGVDLIFLDHWKALYVSDFKFLEQNNVVKKGTTVIADNVICPGVPDYIEYMKTNGRYRSVLYHSQLEYSPHIPDAVLVSTAL